MSNSGVRFSYSCPWNLAVKSKCDPGRVMKFTLYARVLASPSTVVRGSARTGVAVLIVFGINDAATESCNRLVEM